MLHGSWVRASTKFYLRFTLLICSSPGFGSCPYDHKRPYQARFHYASRIYHSLSDRIEQTRWLVLQKARRHPTIKGAPTLRSRHGFRNYFISLTGILFTFPSRYLFTIDLKQYLALEVSAPRFRRDFSSPALLEDICITIFFFSRTGLSPSLAGLSRTVLLRKKCETPFNRVHIPRNPGHLKVPV